MIFKRSILPFVVLAASLVGATAPAAAVEEDALQISVMNDTVNDGATAKEPVSGADADVPMPASEAGSRRGTRAGIAASCIGCLAYNSMYWTNYGAYESVGVQRTQNVADEVIDRQETHVALMHSGDNLCYDGEYVFTDNTGDLFNQTSSRELSSGKYTAFNDRWTQASGHNWYDEGGHFFVNEANDRCRQF